MRDCDVTVRTRWNSQLATPIKARQLSAIAWALSSENVRVRSFTGAERISAAFVYGLDLLADDAALTATRFFARPTLEAPPAETLLGHRVIARRGEIHSRFFELTSSTSISVAIDW
jgi:hypothetical protein